MSWSALSSTSFGSSSLRKAINSKSSLASLQSNRIVPLTTGLKNLGNTCFLNSVLQSLASIRSFHLYVRRLANSKERESLELTLALKETLQALCVNNNEASSIEPPIVKVQILKKKFLDSKEQQDAHELMQYVLSSLSDEADKISRCMDSLFNIKSLSNTKVIFPMRPRFDSTTASSSSSTILPSKSSSKLEEQHEDALCVLNPCNLMRLQTPFNGLLKSTLRCLRCNNVSPHYQKFMDLSLAIPPSAFRKRKGNYTLDECLSYFTDTELVDNVLCSHCKKYFKAEKRLTITRAPTILCLHVRRLVTTLPGSYAKLNCFVKFPMTLDLSPYSSATLDNDDINNREDKGIIRVGGDLKNAKISNNVLASGANRVGVDSFYSLSNDDSIGKKKYSSSNSIKGNISTPMVSGNTEEDLLSFALKFGNSMIKDLSDSIRGGSASAFPEQQQQQQQQQQQHIANSLAISEAVGFSVNILGSISNSNSNSNSGNSRYHPKGNSELANTNRNIQRDCSKSNDNSLNGNNLYNHIETKGNSNRKKKKSNTSMGNDNNTPLPYRLASVIVHHGGHSGGHYTAFRKLFGKRNFNNEADYVQFLESFPGYQNGDGDALGESRKREWVHISDEEIAPVDDTDVLNSIAYMLYYEKMTV